MIITDPVVPFPFFNRSVFPLKYLMPAEPNVSFSRSGSRIGISILRRYFGICRYQPVDSGIEACWHHGILNSYSFQVTILLRSPVGQKFKVAGSTGWIDKWRKSRRIPGNIKPPGHGSLLASVAHCVSVNPPGRWLIFQCISSNPSLSFLAKPGN